MVSANVSNLTTDTNGNSMKQLNLDECFIILISAGGGMRVREFELSK